MSLVGCYLPRHLEKRFWASSYCQQRLIQQERWVVTTAAILFVAQAVFMPRKVAPNPFVFMFVRATAIPVILLRLHLAFFKPHVFLRVRKRLILTARAARMSHPLMAILAGGHDKAVIQAISMPYMPLRNFFFYTGFSPMMALMSAFNGYIDFAYQVPIILATLCMHVYGGVPLVNCAFMTHPSTALPILTSACDWLAQLPKLLLVELHPLELAIDQKLCTAHNSGVVYMIFMHVFIGTVLPLVLTFRTERRMKLLHWLRITGHCPGQRYKPTPLTYELAGFVLMFLVSLIVTWLLSLLPLYECQQ